MAIAIMGFVFPHTMQSVLEEQFTDKIIHTYREDVDLQNLIDFAQQEVSEHMFHCVSVKSSTERKNLPMIDHFLMFIESYFNELLRRIVLT